MSLANTSLMDARFGGNQSQSAASATASRVDVSTATAQTVPLTGSTRTGRAVAAPAAHGLDFALISDQAGFAALEADWSGLFERAGRGTQVFQTFSWNWQWCHHYVWNEPRPPEHAAALVTARRHGRLVMVWPLALERVGGLRQLIWMGEPVSQYGDILADTDSVDDAAIDAAWSFIVKALKPDVVRFRRVRADAVIAPLLQRLSSLQTVVNEAPYLDLSADADMAAYEQRHSNKGRKNRRRLLRRLEEQGSVAFTELARRPEAGTAALRAVEMKQNWLRDRGLLSPAVADPRFGKFMAAVAASERHNAGVQVNAMTLNDVAVGLQIGVLAKQRLALHVIVYDLAYEKSGVGVLHLENMVAAAFQQGITVIDLLAPKAQYKMDWADGAVAVIDHAVPVSTVGRLYAHVYLGFVREQAKALVQRLPKGLRRRLFETH
jgi:CelD/BcsL family acetyltransferase involved in cellulose biosynthesis